MDVCPFIPAANVTMEECVACAIEFAKQVSEELNIPIYLYEEAQSEEYRKKLPQIREGEYEAISERIIKPEWKPDYGPAQLVPDWVRKVTGARNVLFYHSRNHNIPRFQTAVPMSGRRVLQYMGAVRSGRLFGRAAHGHAVAGHAYMKGAESTRLSIRRRGEALAARAAREVAAFLLGIPDAVIAAGLARPDKPNLDRGSHRGHHLDQIEAALAKGR